MDSKVYIKGKTIVPGGRFRGEVEPGKSIHWTQDEQIFEVTEEVAKEIEADAKIVTVRLDRPPAAPPVAAKPAK